MRIERGAVIHTIRPTHETKPIEGDFEIVRVLSALSGPGYYLEVAPVDKPNATFCGYHYPHWHGDQS